MVIIFEYFCVWNKLKFLELVRKLFALIRSRITGLRHYQHFLDLAASEFSARTQLGGSRDFVAFARCPPDDSCGSLMSLLCEQCKDLATLFWPKFAIAENQYKLGQHPSLEW